MFHLVCGSTGAGKTTHAGKLARQLGALQLSIDDWMVTLFAPDMPQPLDWTWISERAARCERQIVVTALQLGRIGGGLRFSTLACCAPTAGKASPPRRRRRG